MSNQPIPDREPIGDAFTGYIYKLVDDYIFSRHPLPSGELVADGDFVIRYGIPYLGKSHYAIVPDLIVLDHGDMLVGDEAWDFLINRSNLYPRSDVLGFRNDGQDEMIVIKQLDFALPFHVLAYGNATDTTPVARLSALIAPINESYPERLIKYLPHYATLTEWQARDEQ